jgi:AcrR family transcriptional regulator
MNESIVKRRYRSPLREAQAEQTRQRILDAGLALFAERGYTTTTVAQIAAAAGVSGETIYASVGSKRGIVDTLLADIDDQRPLERARQAIVERGGTPRVALEVFADTAGHFWARHARLVEVLRKGVGDPEIGDRWLEREAARREFFLVAVRSWPTGSLRAGLDPERAADITWVLTAEEHYDRLVERRGWPLEDYITWMAATLIEQLLA